MIFMAFPGALYVNCAIPLRAIRHWRVKLAGLGMGAGIDPSRGLDHVAGACSA